MKVIKKLFDQETYKKIGCPDLGSKMFFTKNGKKIFGTVSYISFYGFNGKIQIGISYEKV